MSQTKGKPKKAQKHWATLPLSRVSTIMRSSPEVSSVSPDAVALTAKAAELFISQLAKDAHSESDDRTKLDYNDISSVVFSHPRMAFLQDIIPKKITAKEYFLILKRIEMKENSLQNENIGSDKESENSSDNEDEDNANSSIGDDEENDANEEEEVDDDDDDDGEDNGDDGDDQEMDDDK